MTTRIFSSWTHERRKKHLFYFLCPFLAPGNKPKTWESRLNTKLGKMCKKGEKNIVWEISLRKNTRTETRKSATAKFSQSYTYEHFFSPFFSRELIIFAHLNLLICLTLHAAKKREYDHFSLLSSCLRGLRLHNSLNILPHPMSMATYQFSEEKKKKTL